MHAQAETLIIYKTALAFTTFKPLTSNNFPLLVLTVQKEITVQFPFCQKLLKQDEITSQLS